MTILPNWYESICISAILTLFWAIESRAVDHRFAEEIFLLYFHPSTAHLLCWPKANRSRRDSPPGQGVDGAAHIANPSNPHTAQAVVLFCSVIRGAHNGAGGIRTPGAFRHNGFQDRRLKPLGHCSGLNSYLVKRISYFVFLFAVLVFGRFPDILQKKRHLASKFGLIWAVRWNLKNFYFFKILLDIT